jgi:hypothetical protein
MSHDVQAQRAQLLDRDRRLQELGRQLQEAQQEVETYKVRGSTSSTTADGAAQS